MRRRLLTLVPLTALFLAGTAVPSAVAAPPSPPAPSDGVVLAWNNAALQGVRDSRMGPPMVARALAIVHTCIYDAWAAYDGTAVGTRLGGALRRPVGERTVTNKSEAISFAAHRAAVELFPADTPLFNRLMGRLGYPWDDNSTDTTRPDGVGNVACGSVLAFRRHDGSNELGDQTPGQAPYSDPTGYRAVNDPMDVRRFDPLAVHDPSRWQPLTYTDAGGARVTPKCVAPQWNEVVPFALVSDSQFRSPTGPATYPSPRFTQQARELLDVSAHLTDEQKAIAEYWADGPQSELPPGHWNLFAQFVSHRDHHDLDTDVRMFFVLTNAIFDAGIVAWDNKRHFDSVRPITAIRYLFNNTKVAAWGGPGRGTVIINGQDWAPYQPSYFPTPPFQEYSSGHSTFSAAGAEVLRLFTGSDLFGDTVTIRAGASRVEPGITPSSDVTLSWPTFTAAADEAGMSRRYGGIHFAQADLDGRVQGRLAADQAFARTLRYLSGEVLPG
jgi:hypothetical protein